MTTKLTLTIDDSVIKKAKNYARKNDRSLSNLVENYLKALISDEQTEEDITPITRTLRGAFKMPKKLDYKKELSDRLTEKYL